jgi:hypothetical protein
MGGLARNHCECDGDKGKDGSSAVENKVGMSVVVGSRQRREWERQAEVSSRRLADAPRVGSSLLAS